MFFWIGIIIGVVFAVLATKLGFYDTLVHFINALISIYLALFLTPFVLQVVPGAGDIPYGTIVTTAITGIGSFIILYAISYLLLIGQFKVSFSKAFDTLFGGLVGFLLGFLVLSFMSILATTTTVSQVTDFLENNTIESNLSYVCWWCDIIHGFVGVEDTEQPSRQAICKLKDIAREKHQRTTVLHKVEDPNRIPCDTNTLHPKPSSPNDLSSHIQDE
jgi:uncharacterized membrane protein required for colicin V production